MEARLCMATVATETAIQGIGLATVAGVQESSSSGERGGNVDDRFAGVDQLLGKQQPQAGCALDGPGAFWPCAGPMQEMAQHRLVGWDTQLSQDLGSAPQRGCSV